MMNKYRGEVPIVIDGQHLILVFNYHAMAMINGELGEHGHIVLNQATSNCDVKTLAIGICAGLEKHHKGEYTVEKIMDLSPPIRVLQEAVAESLMAAMYGPKGPADENPVMRLWNLISSKWTRLFRRKNKPSDTD